MKNFKKQFMEVTLAFAVINSLAIVKAFAQEIDYNEVNRQNTVIASNQTAAKQSELMRSLFNYNFSDIRLPKKRKLTALEKDQKNLIKCALKFIDKRKALYKGPELLHKILVNAMDADKLTADTYILNEATNKCWSAYNNLTNFKKKEVHQEKLADALKVLPGSTAAEAKVSQFISEQYFGNKKFQCVLHDVSGSAAFGIGLTAGASLLKCIAPSGVIRNYIGPKLGYNGGFGVKVDYNRVKVERKFITGVIAGSAFEVGEEINHWVIIFGRNNNIDKTYYHSEGSGYRELQSLGLGYFQADEDVTLNIRVFNGPRNWSYVLDQLN